MTTENKKLAAELLAGLTTRTVYGRALWAPALVNGDLSGLDRAEVAEMDAWRARELKAGEEIVDCSAEPFFAWTFGIGGELCAYTVLRAGRIDQ